MIKTPIVMQGIIYFQQMARPAVVIGQCNVKEPHGMEMIHHQQVPWVAFPAQLLCLLIHLDRHQHRHLQCQVRQILQIDIRRNKIYKSRCHIGDFYNFCSLNC